MNQIEKVARALCELHIRTVRRHDTDPEKLERMLRPAVNIAWPDFIDQAQSAIAAMPVQAEPVAWMYEYHPKPPETRRGAVEVMMKRTTYKLGRRWTETPLYAFPTPPAGGSDAK